MFNTNPINRHVVVDNYGDAGQTQTQSVFTAAGSLANFRPKTAIKIDPDPRHQPHSAELWAAETEFRRCAPTLHETKIKTSLRSLQEPAKIRIKALT